MIEQAVEKHPKILNFLSAIEKQQSEDQLFDSYQEVVAFLNEEAKKEELPEMAYYLLKHVKKEKCFRGLFCYFLGLGEGRGHSVLENVLVNFVKECFGFTDEPKNKLILDVLLQAKASFIQKAIQACQESQKMVLNFLIASNSSLLQRAREGSAVNLNLNYTSVMALTVVQFWQDASQNLFQSAMRHLLIIDMLQKGQISTMINQSHFILNILLSMAAKEASLNGYWFLLISRLNKFISKQNVAKIIQLEEKAIQIILNTITAYKDLDDYISNILNSNIKETDKKRTILLMRCFCYFVSEYAQRRYKEGQLKDQVIKLIQKLMEVKDYLAFQFLVIKYAGIVQIDVDLAENISDDLISKISKNCLPLYRPTKLLFKPVHSLEISLLSADFESLYSYQPSSKASQSIQYLLDKVLQKRGCKPRAKICPCFNSFMHSTIQLQYEQEFNEHLFMSALNLMSREIVRVQSLNPSQQQFYTLKTYIFNNLKWLLNLNESCLPQHRKCINFKLFDLIIAFPQILKNNDFLQQVTEDLLIERVPETLEHLGSLVDFLKKEAKEGQVVREKLDRIGEKLLKKGGIEGLSLGNKVNLWNIVLWIWEENQAKIKESMQLYSLHEQHWMAKKCVSTYRNSQCLRPFASTVSEIQTKWQENSSIFSRQLNLLQRSLASSK